MDERVRKRTGCGHQLNPLASVPRPAAGDRLGHACHLELRAGEELRQVRPLAEERTLGAVAGKTEVVASGERRQALEEQARRARAEAARLNGHREAAAR